jgi:hypothetical protein
MYKRLNIWDEDKLDIHNRGSDSGYVSHSSKTPHEDYHKNELYSQDGEDRNSDVYHSMKNDDKKRDKKESEDKEKTIVDTVEQEEKYQKGKREDESQHQSHNAAQGMHHILDSASHDEGKRLKNKQKKSIEEAIEEAIKEEKEVIHLD